MKNRTIVTTHHASKHSIFLCWASFDRQVNDSAYSINLAEKTRANNHSLEARRNKNRGSERLLVKLDLIDGYAVPKSPCPNLASDMKRLSLFNTFDSGEYEQGDWIIRPKIRFIEKETKV